MNRLILLVGLPRSGKTTWTERDLFRRTSPPIVSPDAIRLALYGRDSGRSYVTTAEPIVWSTARLMVAALFEAGHDTVILDACNNTRVRRDEWKDPRWRREFVVIDTSPEECIRRAIASGREDVIRVIERMAKYHEPVAEDEREPVTSHGEEAADAAAEQQP